MALNALGIGMVLDAKDAATGVFNRVSGAMGKAEKGAREAADSVRELSGTTGNLVGGLNETAAAAARAAGAFQDSAGKWRSASGKFMSADQLSALNSGGAAAQQVLQGVEASANHTAMSMARVSEALANYGEKLVSLGRAGLSFLGSAAKEAGKFGSAVAEITTLVDESVVSTDKLWEMSLGFTKTFGGDASSHAKALYQTISSGVTDVTEAQKLLTLANKLAIGGMTDAFTAVDVLTSVTAAYSATNLSAAEATDILFTAVMYGKTTAEELGHTLGRVAPIAASLGVTFGELNAAIAASTLQGINTAESVSGLKAAFANVIKPTKDASDEAKRLGIDFSAASLRSLGLAGFLDMVTKSANFSADSLSQLFGSIEALNVVTALTANDGAKLKAGLDSMTKASGATDAAYKKMSQTFDFLAKQMAGKLQVVMIKMGDILLPVLNKINTAIGGMLDLIAELPIGLQQSVVGFVAVVAIGMVLFGTLLLITAAIIALAPAFTVLMGVFAAMVPYVLTAVAVIGVLILAFYGLRQAYEKNLGGFATFVDSVYSKVKLAVQAIVQLFSTGSFSGEVLKGLQEGNQGIMDFAIQAYLWFNRIKNFVVSISDGFAIMVGKMEPAISDLVSSFRYLLDQLGLVKDGPNEAKATWEAFGKAGAVVGEILGAAFGVVVWVVRQMLDYWGGLMRGFKAMGPVWGYVKSAVFELYEALVSVWDSLKAGLGVTDGSSSALRTFGVVVGAVAGAAWYIVGNVIKSIARMIAIIGAVFGTVVGMLGGSVTAISGAFEFMSGLLTGDGSRMWIGFKTMVMGVLQAVINFFSIFVETIAALIDSMAKMFGKDLGLQKGVQAARADLLKTVQGKLSLQTAADVKVTSENSASAQPVVGAPAGTASPEAARVATRQRLADEERAKTAEGQSAVATATTAPGTAMPALAALAASNRPVSPTFTPPAPQPINISQKIQLTVDGAVLAETVAKHQSVNDARSFGPSTTQT